jgi:hypothetical protein
MPHRTRAHHHAVHQDVVGANGLSDGHTPLEQALIESSELKLLLFKTFATLSTYASGFADGGAQARKTLDMLHHRMYVGDAYHHQDGDHHDEDESPSQARPRRAS